MVLWLCLNPDRLLKIKVIMSLYQIATQTKKGVITSDLKSKDSFTEQAAHKPGLSSMNRFLEVGDSIETKLISAGKGRQANEKSWNIFGKFQNEGLVVADYLMVFVHQINGIYCQHDFLLLLLAFITWLSQCLLGFSTVKLLFSPLSKGNHPLKGN